MSKEDKFDIDAFLNKQRGDLQSTIDELTKGSMVEKMKGSLQEVVSKANLKKAAIAGGIGAGAGLLPIVGIGLLPGAAVGALAYLGFKAYNAYNDSKKDDYSM